MGATLPERARTATLLEPKKFSLVCTLARIVGLGQKLTQ
jgi:hypothetical protein